MKYNCYRKFEYSLFALYTIYIHIFFFATTLNPWLCQGLFSLKTKKQ